MFLDFILHVFHFPSSNSLLHPLLYLLGLMRGNFSVWRRGAFNMTATTKLHKAMEKTNIALSLLPLIGSPKIVSPLS